jgi:hypothetical protein
LIRHFVFLFREYGENVKFVGIADHSGCAEDPNGLNHEEVLRLFHDGKCIKHYDANKFMEGRNKSLRILFIESMMIGSMILFLFATESIVAFTPITKQLRSKSVIIANTKRATATKQTIKSSTPFSLQATATAGSDKKKQKQRKDSYMITLLPGDGIGPEITKSVRVVLDALCTKCNFSLELKEALIGGAAIDAVNNPFPTETYEQCIKSDSILLACIGGYKWDTNPRELRPETGLLAMRKQLNLYANLRPAKVLKQLIDSSTLKPEIIDNVDIMVVRELTGDVYFGTPKGIDVIDGTLCFLI